MNKTRKRWLTAGAITTFLALSAVVGFGVSNSGSDSIETSLRTVAGDADVGNSSTNEAATESSDAARYDDGSATGSAVAGLAPSAAVADRSGEALTDSAKAVSNYEAAGAGTDQNASSSPNQSVAVQVQRDIIYTGALTVEVKNIVSKSEEAKTLVAGKGGWLANEQTAFSEDYSSSVLTFRVNPKSFNDTMEALSKLGTTSARTVSSNDVSGSLTDLKGRVKTLEVSIGRLQTFLNAATDPNQIGYLESELLRRETDLESLRGQIAGLDAQVAEGTIVLTLNTDAKKATEIKKSDDGPAFGDGFRKAGDALINVINAIVVGAAVLLPFVVIGLLIWAVVALFKRRRHGSDAAQASATSTGGPTTVETKRADGE